MQIDFHHAVTYVIARWSGFEHDQAETIAHAAQLVDDSTSDNPLEFADGSTFPRLATAHKMVDLSNLQAVKDHVSWVPFHFLPGGDGIGDQRLLCVQNSTVAKAMLVRCIEDCQGPSGQPSPESLHRLGITAHVYVDTWAHQKFAGIVSPVNGVDGLCDHAGEPDEDFLQRLDDFRNRLACDVIPDMGHGKALTYPDWPWLKWSYTNGLGERVVRDNQALFVDAADKLSAFFRRFRAGNANADMPGLDQIHKNALAQYFEQLVIEDGDERHDAWLNLLRKGTLNDIGAVELDYSANGASSWAVKAFGAIEIDPQNPLDAKPERDAAFENSDWKKFHMAARGHQDAILLDILPAHNLILPT